MTSEGRFTMIEMFVKYRRQIPNYFKLRGELIKETDEKTIMDKL